MRLDNPYLLFKRKNLLFRICLPILKAFSFAYYLVINFLKLMSKLPIIGSYRSKCRVISVGNVTLGGTGKTPLVDWIADYLEKEKNKVGIIIRGYKKPRRNKEVEYEYFKIGDEASMLKESLPTVSICVGKNKVNSAKVLDSENCDVAILDDGFQHWRLKRDLDIVTIDCTHSLFNQLLLPLGRLREPLDCLKRADIFVLTKTDMFIDNYEYIKNKLKEIKPGALIVSSIYEPICLFDLKTNECLPKDSAKIIDKPIFLLSGIANPIYFDKLISQLKVKIKRELVFPDHHEYKDDELEFIKELAEETQVNTIITTHKDASRLKHLVGLFGDIEVYYLKIRLKITENEEEFKKRLLSLLPR